jgi:hypothetical protein
MVQRTFPRGRVLFRTRWQMCLGNRTRRRRERLMGYDMSDYVQVNERIEKFYEKYPDGSIQTEIQSIVDGVVIIKAYAYRDREDPRPATGHAYEKENSSFINKTSYIENCETSAVGRALAMLGFEIKKSIASKEEVENAKLQQQQPTKISKQQLDILLKLFVDKEITDEAVQKTLELYKVSDLSELNETQYGQILRKLKGE